MVSRFTRSVPVTINDVLHGHAALDLQSLDWLYLCGYLAQLQVGGQIARSVRTAIASSLPTRSSRIVRFRFDQMPSIGFSSDAYGGSWKTVS